MLLFSDMLYMLVRYASPSGPMCLRCLMLTFSGPVEFLLCFIASRISFVVSVIVVVCSLRVFLPMGLCKFYPPYPASPKARAPSFFVKPVMRPRIMAGGAPAPCERH